MPKLSKKIKRRIKAKKHPAIEVRSGKRETRSYKATRLEVRKSAGGSMQLTGTAIVFGSESQDLGGFVEICSYEAVQKSLTRNPDVFMLWQHDSSQPLARVKTGTLELSLNRAGLDFIATLPNSPLGQTVFQAVKDGTVDSVSFGFNIEPDGGDEWVMQGDSVVRILRDINIGEISPVTWAAYLAPHVDTRSCPVAFLSKLKLHSQDDDLDDDDLDGDIDKDSDDEDDPEICSTCGQPILREDDEAERQAHLELIRRRL